MIKIGSMVFVWAANLVLNHFSTVWGCETAVTTTSLRRKLVRTWVLNVPRRPTGHRLWPQVGAIERWCNPQVELSGASLHHSRTTLEGTVRAWPLPLLLLPGHEVSSFLCLHQAHFPKSRSNESPYKPFLFIS